MVMLGVSRERFNKLVDFAKALEKLIDVQSQQAEAWKKLTLGHEAKIEALDQWAEGAARLQETQRALAEARDRRIEQLTQEVARLQQAIDAKAGEPAAPEQPNHPEISADAAG